MKNKIGKNDIAKLMIVTVLFVIMILLLLKNKYLWGSNLDWINQHSVIPEYFRTLFYDTHKLFPNLALNLGSGQNIYNYAYYGLINPVILLSYLFPFISMKYYIMISTLLLVYASIIMFYFFLKSNGFDSKVSFASTLCFMFASPLLFHSHRHIMFINYMPFLIMALFGVDNYFKNNKKSLLTVSVLLIILMSYYYSIPAIICIITYGIYKYISLNKKITFKSFMKDGIKFILPILVGVMLSCVLILPEFYAILDGRMESIVKVSVLELLVPKVHLTYLIYNHYGLGLSGISIIALINLFFSKKKENRFLGIILSLSIIFPLFNYLLNGTMYIDSKALIPFLPLFVFVIAIFINNILNNKINIKYISIITVVVCLFSLPLSDSNLNFMYIDIFLTVLIIYVCSKYKKYYLLSIYLIVSLFLISYTCNSLDSLVLKNDISYKNYDNEKALVDSITSKDSDSYKITTLFDISENSNNIFGNIDMYQNYSYSSIHSVTYNKFYYDVFNNPMQSRNRVFTTASANILFLMFSSDKYLLSDNKQLFGYKKYEKEDNIISYVNEDVLPYMYVSYNSFNKGIFDTISFPYSNEILLNNVVVEDGIDNSFNSSIHEFNVKDVMYNDLIIEKIDETYSFFASKKSIIIANLPDEAKNKIIMIKLDMKLKQSCEIGDQVIRINNISNKLTCEEWKYYNGNTTFTYVLSETNIDKLNISFYEGKYSIGNIKLYYLDYNDIKNINKKVTKVIIDKNKTKGDNIYASVNTIKDGYFVTTIPYQKGFTIFLDGKNITYENVNDGFIGFKISAGNHNIIFTYKSPFKTSGVIISFIGLIVLMMLIIEDYRKK